MGDHLIKRIIHIRSKVYALEQENTKLHAELENEMNKANQLEDTLATISEEITKLRARVEKLTKAIESTLDYIDGVHNSKCDAYSMCSNCSISFELIAAKDS